MKVKSLTGLRALFGNLMKAIEHVQWKRSVFRETVLSVSYIHFQGSWDPQTPVLNSWHQSLEL